MTRNRLPILLLAVSMLAPLAACDRGRVETTEELAISDADVRDYRLTMEAVERWHQLQVRSGREPELTVPMDASAAAPGGIGGEAATYMARTFNETPDVARAIREGGLTVREFVLIGFALVNAAAAIDAETLQAELPATANRDNMAFLTEHGAEINRMHREQLAARAEGSARESDTPRN